MCLRDPLCNFFYRDPNDGECLTEYTTECEPYQNSNYYMIYRMNRDNSTDTDTDTDMDDTNDGSQDAGTGVPLLLAEGE